MAIHYDFNSISSQQLTDKITMRFVTSSKFTVIQWNLKKGAKLLPQHTHPNEQVTRILKGEVKAQSGKNVYHLHSGVEFSDLRVLDNRKKLLAR